MPQLFSEKDMFLALKNSEKNAYKFVLIRLYS